LYSTRNVSYKADHDAEVDQPENVEWPIGYSLSGKALHEEFPYGGSLLVPPSSKTRVPFVAVMWSDKERLNQSCSEQKRPSCWHNLPENISGVKKKNCGL
jgi:hypothetical protein